MSSGALPHTDLGIVVLGRNEGERLRRCFDSVRAVAQFVVYVDSGSTDGSVELARSRGIEVVHLDMSIPFNCARARNAGLARLRDVAPHLAHVQFVDGDCEVIEGWLEAARAFLIERPDVACVCGRLQERFPERSIYNRMLNIAWSRPAGEVDACGGLAMIRSDVLAAQNGFREDLFAGEDNDLSLRMRRAGWKIWCLARPMAWHDAEMLHFGQWWKRSTRTGFGYAQWAWIHGSANDHRLVRQTLRPLLWAALLPLAALGLWLAWSPLALLLLLAYPLQVLRLAARVDGDWRTRLWHGFFIVLGKFPELAGQLRFWASGRPRQGANPFDYKS